MRMEKFRGQSTAVAAAVVLGFSACSSESAPPDDETVIESTELATPKAEEEAPALEGIEKDISREELVKQLFGTGFNEKKKHAQFGNYILFNFGDPEIAEL